MGDIMQFSKLFRLEDGQPIRLEPWQVDNIIKPVFCDVDPDGLRKVNLSLVGLPKKNGKSTLAGLVASFMLLGDGEKEPEVYGTAGAKDQARIIFNQARKAIERSPMLLNEVTVYRDAIERKDGQGVYKVLSADAPLQHGFNPHCVIWDELWNQPGYDLWEALTHSPARKQPLHFIVTYAGYQPFEGNLLYDLYQRGMAGTDPRMHFFWTHDNPASWVTQDYLDQQRSRLPDHIFRRLHLNEWTTGGGALLTKGDVDAAIDSALKPQFKGHPSIRYFLSLDLGLRRDRTAVCVLHKDDFGVVVLDNIKVFAAPPGGEVRIDEVASHIHLLADDFYFVEVVFDPWQSAQLRQHLAAKGLPITEFIFSGTNWDRMTHNLLTLFKDRQIKIYDHQELVQELLSVQIVERSYGYRIDHHAGAHDDTVVALAMGALAARDYGGANCPVFSVESIVGGVGREWEATTKDLWDW